MCLVSPAVSVMDSHSCTRGLNTTTANHITRYAMNDVQSLLDELSAE